MNVNSESGRPLGAYVGAAFVVLLLLLIVAWIRSLEWIDKEVDIGPTAEIRKNPLFAAQAFLRERGIDSQIVRGFSGLEDLTFAGQTVAGHETLVLMGAYQALNNNQLSSLWQWIENGGNVLVAAHNPAIAPSAHLEDPLLQRLDVELEPGGFRFYLDYDNDDEQTDGEAEADEQSDKKSVNVGEAEADSDADGLPADRAQRCHLQENLTDAQLSPDEPAIQVSFEHGPHFITQNSRVEALGSVNERVYLARSQVGAGQITLLSTAAPFNNELIECFDHAYLLWRLTRDSDKVWFIENTHSPSFWTLMWQTSATGCLALILALLFWSWRQSTRFGPMLSVDQSTRRNFIDHIRATALFVLRQRREDALVDKLRLELLQRVKIRHQGFDRLDTEDQVKKLAQLSGVSASDVRLALFAEMPATVSFVDKVKRLQHLRNRL